MNYLNEVKLRLEIQGDTKDELLLSYINQAENKILSRCNRKDIPEGLNYVLVSIAVDLYNLNSPDRKTTEERQGNRTVKYVTKHDLDAIISSYSCELSKYSRIRVF